MSNTPRSSGLTVPAGATPLAPTDAVQISLYLRRNPANEAAWAQALTGAESGTYLSGEEIARLSAPDAAEVKRTVDFALANDLKLLSASDGDRHVILEGTVAQIESALGVTPDGLGIHEYFADGVRKLTHANEAPVPSALADCVDGTILVRPNQQTSHLRTFLPRSELRAVGGLEPRVVAAATPANAKLGNQWGTFYGCVDDAGQPMRADNAAAGTRRSSLIISYGGGHSVADVNANCQAMGVPSETINVLELFGATNSYTGDPQSADLENILDIASKVGIARGAEKTIAYIPNDNVSSARAKQQFATMGTFDEASESWGDLKDNYTAADLQANDDALQAMAVAGMAYFNSNGDSGDRNGKAVATQTYPSCSKFATGVGGTAEPGPTPAQATVWNDLAAGGGATGCGIDPATPAMPYMAGVSGGGYTGQGRGYAEISMVAAPSTGINVILGNGTSFGVQTITVGGTSLACPLAGAVWDLALQAACNATGNQKLKLGLAGPIVFPMVGTKAIQPVTQGATEDYQAANPYGPPTGLGTLNGNALAKQVAAHAVAQKLAAASGPGTGLAA